MEEYVNIYDYNEELCSNNEFPRGTIVAVTNSVNDPCNGCWIIGVYNGYSHEKDLHEVHLSSFGEITYFRYVRPINEIWPFAKIVKEVIHD